MSDLCDLLWLTSCVRPAFPRSRGRLSLARETMHVFLRQLDQPITDEGCDASGPGTYVVLYGNYSVEPQAGWSFPVALQRTGPNQAAEFATEGSLTINQRHPDSGVLSLSIELEFDEATAAGAVAIP